MNNDDVIASSATGSLSSQCCFILSESQSCTSRCVCVRVQGVALGEAFLAPPSLLQIIWRQWKCAPCSLKHLYLSSCPALLIFPIALNENAACCDHNLWGVFSSFLLMLMCLFSWKHSWWNCVGLNILFPFSWKAVLLLLKNCESQETNLPPPCAFVGRGSHLFTASS